MPLLYPHAGASAWSRLTFRWILPTAARSREQPLEGDDLWPLEPGTHTATLADQFLVDLAHVKARHPKRDDGIVIMQALCRGRIGRDLWLAHLWRFPTDSLEIFSPLALRVVLDVCDQAWRGGDPSLVRGYAAAAGLFLMVCGISVFNWTLCALVGGVYRSAMRLDHTARARYGPAALLTMTASDCARLVDLFEDITSMIYAPYQALILSALLIVQLGWAALVGIGLIAVVLSLNGLLGKYVGRLREDTCKHTDERIDATSDALQAVFTIKAFGWMPSTVRSIAQKRQRELRFLRRRFLLEAVLTTNSIILPLVATLATFAVRSAVVDAQASPALVFSSLALFNWYSWPLEQCVVAWARALDALVALRRIAPVLYLGIEQGEPEPDKSNGDDEKIESGAVIFEQARFAWLATASAASSDAGSMQAAGDSAESTVRSGFSLEDLHLRIEPGQLVAVVGVIASGKSSLLAAAAQEMPLYSGSVRVGGKAVLASQSPLVMSQDLRSNITFGDRYDPARLSKAIRAAALEADVNALPYGDATELGVRGVRCSGGQRARIALARALYQDDAAVLLLDDPFAAVDATVGQQIATRLRPALDGRTCLLATHALHFLHLFDRILVIDEGCIVEDGSYEQLRGADGHLSRLLATGDGLPDEPSVGANADGPPVNAQLKIEAAGAHDAIEAEERASGIVSWRSYWGFLGLGHGRVLVPLGVICLALAVGAYVMSTLALAWLVDDALDRSVGTYIGIYGGVSAAFALFVLLLVSVIAFQVLFSSRALHDRMIGSIFAATMAWHSSVPPGRVLARASRDIDCIDNDIYRRISQMVQATVKVPAVVPIVSIASVYILPLAATVAALFSYILWRTLPLARDLKRLDNLKRSAHNALFAESISDMPTIRSFRRQADFTKQQDDALDKQHEVVQLTAVLTAYQCLRLNISVSVVLLFASLFAVWQRDTINPSLTGIALSSLIAITYSIGRLCQSAALVEADFNSVQRALVYANDLPQEPMTARIEDVDPAWPTRGDVSFRDVSMRYRPELPLVLNDISATIKHGERIGIVGRTGSGKSSLLFALFRMTGLDSGSITIDGLDCADLPLERMRKVIALIPQEVSILAGTIRSNIDPAGEYDDVRLNDALRRAHLLDRRLALDTPLTAGGDGLSAGEKALVGLARALVVDSPIAVMDEATAMVDPALDAAIQQTVANELHGTVMTIAHRLRSVIAYDRIMVIDAGRLIELDGPLALFDRAGTFRSMCDASQIGRAEIESAQAQRRVKP